MRCRGVAGARACGGGILDGGADPGPRHGIRWLYREGELRGGAWGDIERGTGHGRDPTGARRERVPRPGLVDAQIEIRGDAAHRRDGRRAAEGRAVGIAPQGDADRAGESRRDVTEGVKRPHFHRRADLVACEGRRGREAERYLWWRCPYKEEG